jgi:HK97 family phage major capsid protein
MSAKLKQLRDQRGKLVADARAILDKAETDKRALTAEEDVAYKGIFAKQDETRVAIEREEQLAEVERTAAEQTLRSKDAATGASIPGPAAAAARTGPRGTPEYNSAFTKFLLSGTRSLNEAEHRALQLDSDPSGGYTVAPEQFVDHLIRKVDDLVFIRSRATKFRLNNAASMGAPSLDANPDDADWTSELATGNEDSAMTFGKRELHPRPLAKRLKVSNKLIQLNGGIEALVRDRLAYKFSISQEKAFMSGTGANQPLGVFTPSAMGISTGRDVSTSNTTTAPTFDGLISAKYSLKVQYWNSADWIFNRSVLAGVAKLKDGEGQYLWRASVLEGEPDRILGRPVMMSEYVPNTMTTGLYIGILGDFSYYWIADAIDMQVQRLVELYAETNQTGFIGRLETDGMPVLEEAFVRIKLA